MGTGIYGGFGRTHGLKAAVGSVSFMDENQNFHKFMKNRKDIDPNGVFDVIAHGNSISVKIHRQLNDKQSEDVEIDPRTMARLIKSLPNYHGQDVRLMSCNTGADPNGFAQHLANKLNVNVYAPNDFLWGLEDGTHYVAAALSPNQPNLYKLGKFIKFTPGGNKK